jgi:hypothetical protein
MILVFLSRTVGFPDASRTFLLTDLAIDGVGTARVRPRLPPLSGGRAFVPRTHISIGVAPCLPPSSLTPGARPRQESSGDIQVAVAARS